MQTLGQEFASTALGLATTQTNSNVNTSDSTIASISQVTNNNFAVNVSQLAQVQTLTSGTYASSSSTIGITGDSLVLQLGQWNSGTFSSSGTKATTISISDNSLSGIANSINNARSGVTASLVSVSGGVELKLSGQTTGVFGGYSLSTSPDMTALEYDSGAQSLSLTQAATDASYTVNGSMFTSATNSAVPVTTGVDINLNKVGVVTISQVNPPTQMLSNVQSLVGYVNSLVQGISQLKTSLTSLNQSGIPQEFMNSLTQIGFQRLNGNNTITSLNDIGFNVQPDGTVQFNQTQFTTAYGNSPTNTSFVLSEAAIAYAQVSSQYAGSNGIVQGQISELNQLQVAYVYGSQAAVQAAQGSASSRSSPYGATTNPWAGVNFYQG